VPEIQRSSPPFVQIADHYRSQIQTGALSPGDRLPSVSEIATEWNVSRATAANAVGRLKVERLVDTSPQGTYVASDDVSVPTPGTRLQAALPDRVGPSETIEVTAAHTMKAPDYVASLLGLERGTEIIRREEITSLRGTPRMLEVDWIPTKSTLTALGALEKKPLDGGTAHFLETVHHWPVDHAQDHLEARSADTREANALGITVGAPILAGANVWSHKESGEVVMYGEWCIPEKHEVVYTYDVKRPTSGQDDD
jgi:GntR family transcriptional regulator